jgi:hypothetical protein
MKKFYLFMITLFVAIAANAATLTGTVGLWNSETQTSTEVSLSIEASIDGNVVTLPNFLGSTKTFTVAVYSDGTAEDGESAGQIDGTFTIGEKTYTNIYIYAGTYNYPDFTYSEKAGVKTLHFGFYAESDWYDLNITLPDDFEAAEPANPYANKVAFDIELSLLDQNTSAVLGTEKVQAYLSGNKVIIPSYFGTEAIYTVADSTATSSLKDWVATSYTYNGTANSYIYSYGNKYLTYDAATRTVKDYIWLYESNLGFYVSFSVPEIQALSTTVSKYSDWLWQPLENGDITVNAVIDGSVVTLIDYLGEGLDLQVTAYTNGKASHDKSYGAYKGIDFDGQDIIELYAGQWGYDDFSYSEKEGKVLSAMVYLANSATVDDYTTWGYYKIDTTLPEDYEAVDPYADKDVIGILVSYGASDIYNAKAYIEDNNLVFIDLFGASEIVYTVTEDGGVVTENYGWYPCDFEFDGEAEDYIMVYGYTTYDATTGLVTDQLYGDTTGVELTISFALPKALRPTTGISDINVDANAPVEYFNLQGVRVNNPENGGLYIRRQGGKAQKVVIK